MSSSRFYGPGAWVVRWYTLRLCQNIWSNWNQIMYVHIFSKLVITMRLYYSLHFECAMHAQYIKDADAIWCMWSLVLPSSESLSSAQQNALTSNVIMIPKNSLHIWSASSVLSVCVCSMGVLLRSCYEFQNHITMYMYISLCKTNVWYGKKMSKNLFHTALSFGGQIDHSTLYISFVPLVAIFREYTRFLTRALLLRGL